MEQNNYMEGAYEDTRRTDFFFCFGGDISGVDV